MYTVLFKFALGEMVRTSHKEFTATYESQVTVCIHRQSGNYYRLARMKNRELSEDQLEKIEG